MSAWPVENRWDDSYAARFRYSVLAGVERHKGSNSRFTCEDLALQLIIDFASSHRLPLSIKNGSKFHPYIPDEYDSLADFRIAVMKSTGARDLLLDDNTVAVGSGTAGRDSDLGFAQAGDIIVMHYESNDHVQVVTHVTAETINIAQGNFPPPDWHCTGANKNDPGSRCYLGIAIKEFSYVLRDAHWRYTKPGSEMVYEKQKARIRRWNFMSWNPHPGSTWRSKALLAPGRPAW